MKLSTLILTLSILVLLFGPIQAQRSLQQTHLQKPSPHHRPEIDREMQESAANDDPFRQRTASENTKKKPSPEDAPKTFPSKEQSYKVWETYKPFDYDEKKKALNQSDEDDDYQQDFNELLKWSMLAGSVFLVVVLVKSCSRKNGRRQMRRLRQQALHGGRLNMVPVQQQMVPHNFCPVPQVNQQPTFIEASQDQIHEQENLDDKIVKAERELNMLKAMKQQTLRQEFNRKKSEEEQLKRIEMVNAQRKQAFEQQSRRKNYTVGYGPVFYGQEQPVVFAANQQPQQPFQVRGIEPIRQRSNSFKTEASQRPILGNTEVQYRNGIPVGKPIRQNDNDSSFASEYPQV